MYQKSICLRAFVAAVAVSSFLAGCSPKVQDEIVANVGNEKITIADYEKLYKKSNATTAQPVNPTQAERESFLDLMVDYRLKIADAYREGLDRRPDLVTEVDQYRGTLAQSFLLEREVVTPGVRRFYDDGSVETRASHILFSLRLNASPQDSAAAYKKAYEAIDALKHGADFGTLAQKVSEDPSARENRGDLYYFTAGQMVRPFEEASATLQPGEFSTTPARTQFGLHIIKVTDRKPAPGEVKCSHIMIRFTSRTPSPEDTLAAYEKIKAIQDSLAMHIDFADLARRNSGDLASAPHGGDLGWFTRRRWILPFDEYALNLQPGQVSPIVRTVYGYHLIKCYDRRPRKSFEEMKADIQRQYQASRYLDDEAAYVQHLRELLHYTRNEAVVRQFMDTCDSTEHIRDTAWVAGIPASVGRSVMLTIGGKPVTVDSVITILKSRPDLAETALRDEPLSKALDQVCDQLLFAERSLSLERENPEFADILREYRNGLLIYQVEQDNVWNRIAPTDSVLRAFFDGHRDRFVYPNRLDISQLRCTNETQAGVVEGRLKKGETMEQVASQDSARMAEPASIPFSFPAGSARLNAQNQKALVKLADMLKADPSITVRFTAHADTARAKAAERKLAASRLKGLLSFLTVKNGIAPGRVTSVTQPPNAGLSGVRAPLPSVSPDRIEATIMGRQPLVIGAVEKTMVPVNADERAKRADSLSVGGYTAPFNSNGVIIVRLNGRDAARQKTFDETGAEVSSLFQDLESKRLEAEWLDRLHREYPVVEHKELLKDAFVAEHQ